MKNDVIKKMIAVVALSALAACGGGGGGGDSSSSSGSSSSDSSGGSGAVLTGAVADGYLRDARVFLDRNNNHVYDAGEPETRSGDQGRYSLDVEPGDGDLYPVVVEVEAGVTVDEDSGAIDSDYVLESPPGRWQFVSPLTTLVKLEMDKNSSMTEVQAMLKVSNALGVTTSISLFDDYLDTSNVAAVSVSEYGRTHRVARIVASALGRLRTVINQNLGGIIDPGEEVLVSYMISDQIMAEADQVEEALAVERSGGRVVDVDSLVESIDSAINSDTLNTDLLFKYQDRMSQQPESWDMQAPEVVESFPAAGERTSVDTRIVISFDEDLDEALVGNSILTLSGAEGAVSGTVSYDNATRELSFAPDNNLIANSDYDVILSAEVADALGNNLMADVSWSFSTIFDLLPPEMPDDL